jgi:hypothetical protein
MSHTTGDTAKGHYFVPAASNYSTTLSLGIFLMALGRMGHAHWRGHDCVRAVWLVR